MAGLQTRHQSTSLQLHYSLYLPSRKIRPPQLLMEPPHQPTSSNPIWSVASPQQDAMASPLQRSLILGSVYLDNLLLFIPGTLMPNILPRLAKSKNPLVTIRYLIQLSCSIREITRKNASRKGNQLYVAGPLKATIWSPNHRPSEGLRMFQIPIRERQDEQGP